MPYLKKHLDLIITISGW